MEDLKIQKEKHTTKIFWLGLQISFIFAIPAFIGAFVGRKLDYFYQTDYKITIFILLLTFVFSWVLVLRKYAILNRKLKEINEKIKDNT